MFIRRNRLGLEERVRRVENVVLALAGKVKKMAEGYEQSFRTLQDGVTGAGGDLRRSFEAVVQAHDSGDEERFEAAATEHSDFINSLQNMGTGGDNAPRAAQSPAGTAGGSTGDLPQGRSGAPQGPQAQEADATSPKGYGEHDVVVKGRDMSD
jgi:hypothetical protein